MENEVVSKGDVEEEEEVARNNLMEDVQIRIIEQFTLEKCSPEISKGNFFFLNIFDNKC